MAEVKAVRLNGPCVQVSPSVTICPPEKLGETSIGNRKEIRWSPVISARDRLVYLKVIYIIVTSSSSQKLSGEAHCLQRDVCSLE